MIARCTVFFKWIKKIYNLFAFLYDAFNEVRKGRIFVVSEVETVISNREIDAMSGEELLAFARKHATLLGERFPKRPELFFAPRILDEPHLLRRLCQQLGLETFSALVAEQSRREYVAGGRWAAVLLSQGGAIPEEVLRKQESVLPPSLTTVREETFRDWAGEGPRTMIFEYDRPLNDSALFLEVSEKARALWANQFYHNSMTRYRQLSQALELREQWLDMPQPESAPLFYSLGWKPLDVMLAYLVGVTSPHHRPADPDCAAQAAQTDPETAVLLLDPDRYKVWLKDQLHPSYYMDMARHWTAFLYLFCGWTDLAPLEAGHRLKKMTAHYTLVLNRSHTPDWARRAFEEELQKAGLLVPAAPLDWTSPKLAKLQRLMLTKALVCHYQWRISDLLAAQAAGEPALFSHLVWGIYREDRLITAFLLDQEGTAWDEAGEPLDLPADAQIGLVSTAELSKKQLACWKRRIQAAGGKPPIRQLSLPSQPPVFSSLEGSVTKHITLYTTAGRWGMEMGDLPCHCRADLVDPLHGWGARITFDPVWNGSEYNSKQVVLHGVSFYRFQGLPFGDVLPKRALVPPEKLPARFIALAGAAYQGL